MLNVYLFLAFSALWVIFFIYAWSLSRRQTRLRKELEELRSSLEGGRGEWKSDVRTAEGNSQSTRKT